VAAALGHAITKVRSGGSVVQKVRIFSDCKTVLQGLSNGSNSSLGPALASGWAIQAIYDHTDFLKECGVSVQLVWRNDHGNSNGNTLADRAACETVWS
jgi:ribonuclease HI